MYSEGGLALWSSDSGKLNESTSVLQDGDSMGAGQSLWSPSNLYHADMQSDGNFVVYPAGDNASTGGAIWNSVTGGNPGDYVTLQTDGNLVIYPAGDNSSTGGALWNSGTNGNSGDYLKMQDDGNLVVYSEGGLALWSSDSGRLNESTSVLQDGDSMGAGQSLWSPSNLYHADMQSDGNFVVYPAGKNSSTLGAIWSTGTGDPGDYVTLQTDGNLVIYPAGDNSSTGGALWNAVTEGNSGDYLAMQDDGNLVIYSRSGSALWSSDYGKAGGGETAAEQEAVTWADAQVGLNEYGYACLAFVREAWLNGNVDLKSEVDVSWGANTYPDDIWGHFTSGTMGSGEPTTPGALVFYAAGPGGDGGSEPSHVQIYVGNNTVVSSEDAFGSDVHTEPFGEHQRELGWWLPDG